jgi:hypothetical protein
MVLSGGHASATELARFKAEAEAVAKLQSPNVVQVYEVGEAEGLPYFSLEFCPGGSLEHKLAGAPQPPREAAALIETLARAVHAAHQVGIVHRDLKPANVLVSLVGTPKLTDFGLAKQVNSGTGRTASGAILGTPSYMAPERATGSKEIGPPADTYALGAILYELLTGRPPFRAATPLDTVLQVVSAEPVPPTRLNSQVPRDLETVALKCLQKESAKRYASAAALADDLHRWQAGEPIAARPTGWIEKLLKWAKRRPAVAALSAAVILALAGGFSRILYELRIANEARARAETQEGLAKTQEELANQRADDLAKVQACVRRELHRSDLLRAHSLLQGNDPARAEEALWRSHFTRPDDDDRRAIWQLWELYRQRPRRSGMWIKPPAICRISSAGRLVAVLSNSRITISDVVTGTVKSETTTTQDLISGVFFSGDGRRLALVSTADGSIGVWDFNHAPKVRATLAPSSPFRRNLTMTVGAALADLRREQLVLAQRAMFFGQTQVSFLSGDRILVTGPENATLWSLKGPVVVARCDLERDSEYANPLGFVEASLPLTSPGDTIPVKRAGVVQLSARSRRTDGSWQSGPRTVFCLWIWRRKRWFGSYATGIIWEPCSLGTAGRHCVGSCLTTYWSC